MKILVTGGNGFIGSNLIDHLIDIQKVRPQQICVLVPPWENLSNLDDRRLKIVIGDIRNYEDVKKSVEGVDVIYHLAAKTIIPGGTYDYYKDVNIEGTKNLIEAAKNNRLKKFVFFSSISVFGLPAWKGEMINISEKSLKGPSEPYGQTKLEAEKILVNLSKKYKFPYIIIRPTTVYGPRDKAGIYQLIQMIKRNLFFYIGDAKNKMDYVYVKDLVRAACEAEKSSINNEDFIIGSGKPQTQKEIVATIYEILGKKETYVYLSKALILPIGIIYEKISKILGIKPIISEQRIRVLTTNCFFNCQKAEKILGYKPKFDLKMGISATIKSMSL
jgi:nucleoside-diphosphate-sugar epimerase